jgi:hypothetical protein
MHKQSQSQVYLIRSLARFWEGFQRSCYHYITGQDKQRIVVWQVVCLVGLCCSFGVVSVTCQKDVIDRSCPSLIPRWLQKRMAQSKGQQIQNGERGAKFFSCV